MQYVLIAMMSKQKVLELLLCLQNYGGYSRTNGSWKWRIQDVFLQKIQNTIIESVTSDKFTEKSVI